MKAYFSVDHKGNITSHIKAKTLEEAIENDEFRDTHTILELCPKDIDFLRKAMNVPNDEKICRTRRICYGFYGCHNCPVACALQSNNLNILANFEYCLEELNGLDEMPDRPTNCKCPLIGTESECLVDDVLCSARMKVKA